MVTSDGSFKHQHESEDEDGRISWEAVRRSAGGGVISKKQAGPFSRDVRGASVDGRTKSRMPGGG